MDVLKVQTRPNRKALQLGHPTSTYLLHTSFEH